MTKKTLLLSALCFTLLALVYSCAKDSTQTDSNIKKADNGWHPPLLEIAFDCGTECNNNPELCLLSRVTGAAGEVPSVFDYYRCSCEGCPLYIFGIVPDLPLGLTDMEKLLALSEIFPMPNADFESFLASENVNDFVVDQIKIHYYDETSRYGVEYIYTNLTIGQQSNVVYIIEGATAGSGATRFTCDPPCATVCLVEVSSALDVACSCDECVGKSKEVPHPLDPDID